MLNIIKCWSLELSISKTIDYLKLDNTTVCRQTIGEIFKANRMVCSIALNKKEIRLGGENLTVQIDEINQMDENIGDIIFDQQDGEDGQDEKSDEYREFFERMNFFFDMATVDVEQVNDHVEQVNDHVEVNDESIESFTINY